MSTQTIIPDQTMINALFFIGTLVLSTDLVWSADRETGLVDLMEVKLQSQTRKIV